MANKTIHELSTLSTVTTNDQIVVYNVASSVTQKLKFDNIYITGSTFADGQIPYIHLMGTNNVNSNAAAFYIGSQVNSNGSATTAIGSLQISGSHRFGLFDQTNFQWILAKDIDQASNTQGSATTFWGLATDLYLQPATTAAWDAIL